MESSIPREESAGKDKEMSLAWAFKEGGVKRKPTVNVHSMRIYKTGDIRYLLV